jgi:hypothetical protein
MPSSWFAYWRPEQIQHTLQAGILDHVGSQQFQRVSKGDTIWVVGTTRGKLFTVGHITVPEVLTQAQARARLSYVPWDAKWHVVVPEDRAEATRLVDLSAVSSQLRFASARSPRLAIKKGKVDSQQLRTLRQLREDSARLVLATWNRSRKKQDRAAHSGLSDLGELDSRREALFRREQHVLRELVVGAAATALCALCQRDLPIDLLVAAHIKRRSECTDAERRDYVSNVVPMCKLGCDDLFERGYVVVREGRIARGSRRASPAVKEYSADLIGRRCTRWNERTARYFRWHARKHS